MDLSADFKCEWPLKLLWPIDLLILQGSHGALSLKTPPHKREGNCTQDRHNLLKCSVLLWTLVLPICNLQSVTSDKLSPLLSWNTLFCWDPALRPVVVQDQYRLLDLQTISGIPKWFPLHKRHSLRHPSPRLFAVYYGLFFGLWSGLCRYQKRLIWLRQINTQEWPQGRARG